MARIDGVDEQRLQQWISRVEALAARVLRRVLRGAARLVARAPTPGAVSADDLSTIPDLWATHMQAELAPMLGRVWVDAAGVVADALADLGRPVPAVGLDAPDAEDFLRAATNRLVGVGDTLWEAARDALATGVEAGESVPQLAARVRAATGVHEGRARTIARTETIAASNAASLAQALRLGDPGMRKRWVDADDSRVRAAHADADGQTVVLGDPFEVGGEWLMYPGQPIGTPANVINERCSMVYLVDDEAATSEGDAPLVAAAEPQTGAMVALIPSDADIARLAVDGGTPPEELHLTLAYLGEAADIPPDVQATVVDRLRGAMTSVGLVEADGFAVSVFNPGEVNDRDPCVVVGVSGDALENVHDLAEDTLEGIPDLVLPDQHTPWIPHVTLTFADDAAQMVPTLADRVGPIMFDRVRVAFAGTSTDIPLAEAETPGTEDDEDEAPPMATTPTPDMTNTADAVEDLQRSDEDLRDYWVRGEGALRIRWGTPGSFRRCTRLLGDHVRDPEGLCAEYHHEATGKWPGEKNNTSTTTVVGEATNLQAMPMPGPDGGPMPDGDCPPGEHRMPGGGCMSDDEMEPRPGEHFYTSVMEGVSTGWREFAPDSITWRDPPFAYHWQYKSSAHNGTPETVQVGLVDRVVRDGATVHFFGHLDLDSPDGVEYARRLVEGFARWSSVGADEAVDAEEIYPEPVEGDELAGVFGTPERIIFRAYRVAEVSAVSVPALADAMVEPTQELIDELIRRGVVNDHPDTNPEPEPTPMPEGEPGMLVASTTFGAVGSHDTATTGGEWDGPANEKRLPSPMPVATARAAYAWVDTAAVEDGMVPKVGGRFIHHQVSEDGSPGAANTTACSTGIGVLHGGRGGTTIPDADRRGVYNHLAAHLRDAGMEPPSFSNPSGPLVAAGHTITIPDVPPAWWFDEPTDVTLQGALTITDEGRVYGCVAPANIAHRSFPGRRVTVPMGKVDYTRWMGGEVIVAGGGRVAAGPITMNCGHMPPTASSDPTVRMEHYDNTCSVVIRAAIGENQHWVWMAGALMPGVSGDQVARMMTCRLSGDWAPHPERSGWTEFVAALLVPVPGFPMARSGPSVRVAGGALVASAVPVRFATPSRVWIAEPGHSVDLRPDPEPDLRPTLEIVAQRIGRDTTTRMQQFADTIHRNRKG